MPTAQEIAKCVWTIQIVKKSNVFAPVQYVHSNPHNLLLTSRGLARKVRTLVLTLKLQEPKNAMRPREVRLRVIKGYVGEG